MSDQTKTSLRLLVTVGRNGICSTSIKWRTIVVFVQVDGKWFDVKNRTASREVSSRIIEKFLREKKPLPVVEYV